MKSRFLISTAVGLVFATAAFAQSPNSTTTAPTTTQTQAPKTSSTPSQSVPNTSAAQALTSTTTTPSSTTTTPQTQTAAPASSAAPAQPAQTQTNTTTPAAGQAQQAPAAGQAQQAPTASTNTTAQQPVQSSTAPNTAQSSTNVNSSVSINDQQRTRVTESITRLNVQPVNNVNFSLSVGTAIPTDIQLQTLPADVVEIVPQYRGYNFFVVRDEIVIVEPSSHQIVTVIDRTGRSAGVAPAPAPAPATAPAPSRQRASFTDKDREIVRKHVKTRTVERPAVASSSKVVIRRGERLPESEEIEEFPETVYRDAPSLREYRYIHRENRTYLVDPGERRVIEEID